MSVSELYRPTMAELIDRVRRLIGDTDCDAPQFDDIALQQHLDAHRRSYRHVELRAAATITPSATTYLDFYAPDGMPDWETDGVLVDGSYSPLTPDTEDWLTGHWTFTAEPVLPVMLTGCRYDIAAASADAAEAWAAAAARCYDVTADGQSFSRSQIGQALLETAARLRLQAEPVSVLVGRGDVR